MARPREHEELYSNDPWGRPPGHPRYGEDGAAQHSELVRLLSRGLS